jgi:hypothetical protein
MDTRPSVAERLLGSRKVWVALTAVVGCVLAMASVPAEKASALCYAIAGLGMAVAVAIGIEDAGRGSGGPKPPIVNGLLLALGLGLLLATAGGCQGATAPYLAADRATLDAVGTDYEAYVDRDPSLTLDQRRRRHRTIDSWRFRLDAAEGRVPAAGP